MATVSRLHNGIGDINLGGAIMPTGTVLTFAGSTAPSGWLLCDGAAVNRSTYSNLYSVIGNAHGSGDGLTTFNVPDLRGRFVRGVDGAAGRDPDKTIRIANGSGGNTGNAVGSVQGMATSKASGNEGGTKTTAGLVNTGNTVTVTGDKDQMNANQKPHRHTVDLWNSGENVGHAATTALSNAPDDWSGYSYVEWDPGTTFSASGSVPAQAISGDNETRPVNVNMNYIIKV